MSRMSTQMLKTALSTAQLFGADRIPPAATGTVGVMFMLHQVSPEPVRPFEPNRILRITPEFLRQAIQEARKAGFECVSSDEACRRLSEIQRGNSVVPFACFTLDDGYRDNATCAYPVFRELNVPFTVFVASDFCDGNAQLWWLALEEILRCRDEIAFPDTAGDRVFTLQSVAAKNAAFHEIYWALRAWPEADARAWIIAQGAACGFDACHYGADQLLTWDEIRQLNRDPLVTIGAHTVRHYALAKLSPDEVHTEIADSVARVSEVLGAPCEHFSYPYGDASSAGPRDFEIARGLGLKSAVTTRKGLISNRKPIDPLAMPRLSLNGDFQDRKHLAVLLRGLPLAALDAARRLGLALESGAPRPSSA